jgi:UDP-glucose 4-epimerase
MLQDMGAAGLLSSVVFRYFNAAGASKDGQIGEDHYPETHLIPLAIEAASGKRDPLKVFGNDYPTKDGTSLRDYVHVEDLSRAHVAALGNMSPTSGYEDYNLGTGKPFSILEVLDSINRVSGLPVPHEIAERREGDPPALYADSSKARMKLGWVPQYTEIDSIVETAWQWHLLRPRGYDSDVNSQDIANNSKES